MSVSTRTRRPADAPHPSSDELIEAAELGRLDRQGAYRLARAEGSELLALLTAATALRERHKGRLTTYSRKVFIPLTNLCRDKCGYCTFARPPADPKAKTMTPDEVLAVARAGREQGCKEALFSLGEKPEEVHALAREHLGQLGYRRTVDYLADMCRLVFEETGLLPHVNCGVLTREELELLSPYAASMGIMLENVSDRLMLPGHAHYGCVGKQPSLRLETMRTAGELGIAFTSGILIGIGETLEERVDSLYALRELQDESGNVQEVIIQNFRVKPDIRMRHAGEPSALEMVRTLALGRLIFGPEQNIQAPPNLTPEAYQQYLFAGINDWGGVSPVTLDHINPERAWPMIRELRDTTAEAGYELRERLCLYPEYLANERFVREPLRARMAALVDERGIVREEETRW